MRIDIAATDTVAKELTLFHRIWVPVCLAENIANGALHGADVLGTRVFAYRGPEGEPVVQEAWCPHLGADLSLGTLVEGHVQCAYHHWRFDRMGQCAAIPTGDKIPRGARIATYPAAEAYGLVWAFNGHEPLYGVPRIPGVEQQDLVFEARLRGTRQVPPWVSVSNGVDFQHLRTLHNLSTVGTESLQVHEHSIEYRIENGDSMQHGLIQGTNVFGQHLRRNGADQFMLFAGAPIDAKQTRSFFVVGVKRTSDDVGAGKSDSARLEGLRAFVEKLIAEDEPVLNTMRFRVGTLSASDRHLARYFKYVNAFPRAGTDLLTWGEERETAV